jgi:hypothetical protein
MYLNVEAHFWAVRIFPAETEIHPNAADNDSQ